MRIDEIYEPSRLGISFELFPPKTAAGEVHLFEHLAELVEFRPDYITCTYGAGGSTRDKTLNILERIRKDFGLPVASHLTCVGSTVDELRDYLRKAGALEIGAVVALRGDPPQGETDFVQPEGGLRYANELVELIHEEFPGFAIIVGGHPETHPEASSFNIDVDNLKRKVDAGAGVIVTQFFFNNSVFLKFRDKCTSAGMNVPIVPGILPVTNLAQIERFTKLCGATLSPELLTRLEGQGDDRKGQFDVGVYWATRQVEQLIEEGVPGVHFYVLNKSRATAQLLNALTLSPRTPDSEKE